MPLPDELAREDVRVVAVQYVDGSIATEGHDEPLIYLGGSDYTVHDARWGGLVWPQRSWLMSGLAGSPSTADLLAAARTELHAAYIERDTELSMAEPAGTHSNYEPSPNG